MRHNMGFKRVQFKFDGCCSFEIVCFYNVYSLFMFTLIYTYIVTIYLEQEKYKSNKFEVDLAFIVFWQKQYVFKLKQFKISWESAF